MTDSFRVSRQLIGALALVIGLVVLEATAFFLFFADRPFSTSDFYIPWRAVQLLLTEGQDPYGPSATRTIQMDLFGRELGPDEHQFGFAYPLFVIVFVGPLSGLPYSLAQAIWMALLHVGTMFAMLALLSPPTNRLRVLIYPTLLLFITFFYPTTRAVLLGQIALPAVIMLALAIRAERDGFDILAGAALALSLVKPQVSGLVVVILLLRAIMRQRPRLLLSFVVVGVVLLLFPMLWFPTWPQAFIQSLAAYLDYTDIGAPTQILAEGLHIPALHVILSAACWLALGWHIFHLYKHRNPLNEQAWELTLGVAILVTLATSIRTATTNQVLALLPLIWWLNRGPSRLAAGLLIPAFLFIPWAVFLLTVQGNTEQPVAYLPVPLLLALLLLLWPRTLSLSTSLRDSTAS
jgi:hypothetical protein